MQASSDADTDAVDGTATTAIATGSSDARSTGGAESGDTSGMVATGPDATTSAEDADTSAPVTSTDDDGPDPTTGGPVDETCNGVDDDADGAIDEFSPVNDACGPCRYEVGPNVAFVYAFCDDAVTQPAARAHCQQLGGDLASIHDDATNDFVFDRIHDRSFIGFNDVETEDSFVWTDGTDVDYVQWDGMEPNDAEAGQDCAVMRDAEPNWDDVSCGQGHFYVCRGPL